MTNLFLRFELEKKIKYFRTKTLAKVITSVLFLLVFLFIALGIYMFFVSGLRYINVQLTEDIQAVLTLFIYELFLVILGGILIVSVAISGLFNLFKGSNNNWLISSPGYKIFPKIVLLRSVSTSLLPALVMFIPAMIAFNKIYGLGFISLVLVIVSITLLLVLINSLTLTFVVAIATLYKLISQKIKAIAFTFGGLVALLIAIFGALVFLVWNMVRSIDLVKIFKADEVTEGLATSVIGNHFAYLPTHPFAMELVSLQLGDYASAFKYVAILAALTLFSYLVWTRVSTNYYPLWQRFQEGNSTEKSVTSSYAFKGTAVSALFEKERLVFSRNFKGILWFLFLFLIWIIQILTNKIVGTNIGRYETDITEKLALLQAIQFIIALYFIAAFALRFVFPSFSVEKKTAWILLSAPLSFKKIFYGKYFFFITFFVLLGLLMSGISNLALGIGYMNTTISILLFVVSCVCIVTLALTLGALFPNRDTDDPEAITTSLPGLFFTAISLMYGAFMSYALYEWLHGRNFLLIIAVFGSAALVVMMLFTPKAQKLS